MWFAVMEIKVERKVLRPLLLMFILLLFLLVVVVVVGDGWSCFLIQVGKRKALRFLTLPISLPLLLILLLLLLGKVSLVVIQV